MSESIDKAIDIILIAPYVIAAASAIAALTPTPKDDKFLGKLRKVVDVLALNVKHARNEHAGIRDK